MKIEKEINGSCATLILSGWMDTVNAPLMAAAVDELGTGISKIILDMSGLEYMSSAGIRQIIATHKRMDGALTLKNVPSVIMDVFNTLGLAGKLNIVS